MNIPFELDRLVVPQKLFEEFDSDYSCQPHYQIHVVTPLGNRPFRQPLVTALDAITYPNVV